MYFNFFFVQNVFNFFFNFCYLIFNFSFNFFEIRKKITSVFQNPFSQYVIHAIMGRSWRASSDLTAQKIRLFYSQKMLTKYEAFFTEIYENDRFSQGVGWKCKVFFANPVLGGRTKSAVRAHNHSYDWIIYCKRRFCAGSRFRRWNRTFRVKECNTSLPEVSRFVIKTANTMSCT